MSLTNTTQLTDDVVREIARAISDLRYGSIEITVHEGRVTQIEKREKVRFNPEPPKTKPTASTAARN